MSSLLSPAAVETTAKRDHSPDDFFYQRRRMSQNRWLFGKNSISRLSADGSYRMTLKFRAF